MPKLNYKKLFGYFRSFFARLWNNLTRFKNNLSKLKYLLFVYFFIVLIATLLLWAPFSQNEIHPLTGEPVAKISFIDAIFTASSAFSDTGLTVKPTFSQFNIFGQFIIAMLILAGGIGIFALKLFVFNFIFRRKTLTLRDVKMVQTERGGQDDAKVAAIVISSLKFLFITIIIFGFVLSLYFYFAPDAQTTPGLIQYLKDQNGGDGFIKAHHNWENAFRFGFFQTISAINNAGFDILSGSSLMQFYGDYFVQICLIILFVIGGLGYPVLYDIKCWILHKIKRKKGYYKFTLFTKISLIIYVLILLAGFGLTLIFEIISRDANSAWNKIYIKNDLQHQYAYQLYLYNKADNNLIQESINQKIPLDTYIWQTSWKDLPIRAGDSVLLKTKPNAGIIDHEMVLKYKEILKPYLDNGKMYGTKGQIIFGILFTSLSTRSAGFYTIGINDFTYSSYITYSIMMFIGSAPSSTGGGIRTTTFAIILMSIIATFRGEKRIRIFWRAISRDNIFAAMQVFIISLIIIFVIAAICTTSLDVYQPNGIKSFGIEKIDGKIASSVDSFKLEQVYFEVFSAFGTTGLSSGLTPYFNAGSKIAITILMFIGQFGISSLLFVWKKKHNHNVYYDYVEEDVAIG